MDSMNNKTVVLIAFEEQDNLGIGYLGSSLQQGGFQVQVVDFRIGKNEILSILELLDPLIVGFSIIFQHYIDDFRNLIGFLRAKKVKCHFSAGGHYPSLSYEELFGLIPDLDSVVLFEGEITFLELAHALLEDLDWKNILGIAYQKNGQVYTTGLRPLEKDLDRFPPPLRRPLQKYAFDKKFATLLAGRGCFYNCAFCSIHEFYSTPPGPIKRVRQPEMVVREMELLHEQGCSVFLFQDDDFPINYQKGSWLDSYLKGLKDNGLNNDEIIWKINCRPDEVSYETFSTMKSHGLFLTYLGIESGTDEGLARMNKHTKVETNLEAVQILKDLEIVFDFGFMLFDPSSTIESISRNIDFLETICCDGSSPITFCKMLPYAGTKIERELRSAGRLIGRVGREDYHFVDPNVDNLYTLMVKCFADWIGDHDGVLNLARWVRYFLAVYRKHYTVTEKYLEQAEEAQRIIAMSNAYFIQVSREMLAQHHIINTDYSLWEMKIIEKVRNSHEQFRKDLNSVIDSVETLTLS